MEHRTAANAAGTAGWLIERISRAPKTGWALQFVALLVTSVTDANSVAREYFRDGAPWSGDVAVRAEDIDFSDIPEQGPDFFAHAILLAGPKAANYIAT